MTERLHFHFSLSCIGEGNGNPLRWSCLENSRDRGAWWGTVYGVAQSQTRLKRLSSSSSRFPKVSQLVGVRVRIRIRTQKCSSICLTTVPCLPSIVLVVILPCVDMFLDYEPFWAGLFFFHIGTLIALKCFSSSGCSILEVH